MFFFLVQDYADILRKPENSIFPRHDFRLLSNLKKKEFSQFFSYFHKFEQLRRDNNLNFELMYGKKMLFFSGRNKFP